MKKFLSIILALLFLSTGLAMASDFSISGSYFVRGTYLTNSNGIQANASSYGEYDHELSIDTTWKMSDSTKVFARFEMRDEVWGKGNVNEGPVPAVDDNVYLEQVWGEHTFCNGHQLTVGLMSAAAWGTKFADSADEAYRIKYMVPTAVGNLYGIIEKGDSGEKGQDTYTAAQDSKDSNIYHLGFITKAGNVYIKPLLSYADATAYSGTTFITDVDKFVFHLAVNGDFDAFGFEGEFRYENVDFDQLLRDYDAWGIYGNVWANAGAAKIGILGAYGSYDDTAGAGGAGLDFGDDFDELGFVIMGENVFFGGGAGLVGSKVGAVYVKYQATEKLSLQSLAGYGKSNIGSISGIATPQWDGASMFELNLTGAYKITDNLTYDFGAAYADLEYGDSTPDPDSSYELYHKLTFSF
jgi:hypothetical protein